MDIFKSKTEALKPDLPKDTPRKKGFRRFFEILSRDFIDLIKLNFLLVACLLPTQALFVAALLIGNAQIFVALWVLSAMAAILAGPGFTAFQHVLSKMLRDDPRFLKEDFGKVFRENFRQAAIPGIVVSVCTELQVLVGLFIMRNAAGRPDVLFAFVLSTFLFHMTVPYFFLQISYLPLKTFALVKNSFLLMLNALPKSFLATLSYACGIALTVLLFTAALVPGMFIGYVFPGLIALMLIWASVDKIFNIEGTLRSRNETTQLK